MRWMAMNGATVNAMKRGNDDQRPPRKLIALCLPGRSFAPRCSPIASSRVALSTHRRHTCLPPRCSPFLCSFVAELPSGVRALSRDFPTTRFSIVMFTACHHSAGSFMLPVCRQSDNLCACDRFDRQAQAPVAQLDRALPSEGKGHTFESCRARQFFHGPFRTHG
jgi:hypothetical protein